VKVAAITVSYNDDCQLQQWSKLYEAYKNELSFHIIVDNGSETEYKELLRKSFRDSAIIEREVNGGTTAAYNDGIKYALRGDADAILLIAQDVRLSEGSVTRLYELLYSDEKIGVVGPVLLSKGSSNVIQEYGGTIDLKTILVRKNFETQLLSDQTPDCMEVDFIAGGMNLTKREVYEKVALQDERLFMYCDETDWDIRVKRFGYRLVVTKKAMAWHEHVFEKGKGSNLGSPLSYFLQRRNQLLLVKKYGSKKDLIYTTIEMLRKSPSYTWRPLFRLKFLRFCAHYLGIMYGFFGIHKIPFVDDR
jgi:GT2 family glycosyltransferase